MSRTLSPAEAEVRRVLEPGATHYEVLRLGPAAAAIDHRLSVARRAVLLLVHPDRWVDAPAVRQALAHDAAARANEAHRVLSDPKARRLYDASLLATHVVCTGCKGSGWLRRTQGFNRVEFDPCRSCKGTGYRKRSD